jgi:pyridinium-3,5-bisthiocarboxylic acid mononucleotide nickel chelatase
MRIAYFDCFSGISGDMVLGALLDLGVPREALFEELRKIPVTGYSVRAVKEERGLIGGTRVIIEVAEQPHRSLGDIRELIYQSKLNEGVQRKILDIFEKLAQAESRVHHLPVSEIHFHEVGAVDSILDIAGAVIGLEYLKVDRVLSSPVPVGRGFVTTHHGILPLPAPATVQLLEGVPIYGSKAARELVTPTGAALLACLVEAYGPIPEMILQASGYGVGKDLASDPPNLLRMLVGVSATVWEGRRLILLETNIDDMNPEFYGYVLDSLFALGVLDASVVPIQMKKNRPGVMLQVLFEPVLQPQVVELLFRETTTLGVRIQEVKRVELSRKLEMLDTPYGPCQMKRVFLPDGSSRLIPEYDACRRFAEDLRKPLREVYEDVLLLARQGK